MGAISTPANWLTIVNKPATVADLGVSDFNAKAIQAQAGAAAGGVGTYALMNRASQQTMTAGTSYAGSTLRYSGFGITDNGAFSLTQGATPAGTWLAVGTANVFNQATTLCVRTA